MKQCYDWENNILQFEDKNKNKFELCLKGNKTIVCGKSATGKTLICDILKGYIEDENNAALRKYDANNIFVLNKDNIDKLEVQKNKLILIDRADFLLTERHIEVINKDTDGNRYLIFARKPLGIDLSPNYFAILKREGDITTLEYLFDVRGWN